MGDDATNETVELLRQLIRNRCVNDGSASSGQEVRNADLLTAYLDGTGCEVARFEPTPGRVSTVHRLRGTDPGAPSLCLMGHTDVVPVDESGWSRDPFGGELVDDEVWGRGAVDMLNLTASMAVAVRSLVTSGLRPCGDLLFFAVADEESGSAHGARWLADNDRDAIVADYVLTENGGLHNGPAEAPWVSVNVGEKGVAWRRLRLRGTPGHGSMPFGADNALVKAAAVLQRLTEYRPRPRTHELWRHRIDTLGLDDEMKAALLDEDRIDDVLATLPRQAAAHLHASRHTTFSCNGIEGTMKTNVIPGVVDLLVDIRTLPGEHHDDVDAHLREALGELYETVEVEVVMDDAASMSRMDTPLWDALQRAVNRPFPGARLSGQLIVGFTDARVYRDMGAVAYGAGLLSPSVDAGEFGRRFHGNDERIDIESLRLTTDLFTAVTRDVLGG